MRHLRLACVALLLFTLAAIGAPRTDTLVGKVVGVHDGDTITLLVAGKTQYKIRLDGIDAPELKQDFGQRAKEALSALCFGKGVRVKTIGTDRYGRTLGTVYVNGADVNRRMVADGFAWHYVKYSDSQSLASAEAAAREKKLGLWHDRDPAAPWDWRATQKQKQKRASSSADALLPIVRPPESTAANPEKSTAGTGVREFWLNTETGVRHNKGCQYFNSTQSGRFCAGSEGRACKKCGG